jgi:hypothetical protein
MDKSKLEDLIDAASFIDTNDKSLFKNTDKERLFAKAMMNEHRTLQQSTMRLFMTCIEGRVQ